MDDIHPIAAHRAAAGKTQQELGEQIGVSSVTVSRWETGARKVDLPLLSVVSEVTGIAKRDLRPDLAHLLEAEAR